MRRLARALWPGPASLRLSLGVAAAVILVALAAMAVQYRLTERTLDARQTALLQADLDALAALYQQRRIPALRAAMEFRAVAQTNGEALFLLLDKQGAPLAGNLTHWPSALPQPQPGGFDTKDLQRFSAAPAAPGTYLGVARLLPGGFALLVARATAPVEETLAALRRLILAVAAALVVVALAAGLLVSHLVMRRIRRLNDLANRVTAGDLGARLPGARSADEFGQLESHMHRMLDRIQALNRATHRLSDSIAHELRTPLNRIMQKLAALGGDVAARAEVEREMRATIRIFDALLEISSAEAESGSAVGAVPVDLSQLAGEVFELYAAAGEEKGLQMQAQLPPGLWVLGERNLLAQLLANLLDNAVKFTPRGGRVLLELAPDGGRQRLSVTDSGPGLDPDQRARVLERFARAPGTQQVQGHGLGLALVKAIITRYGAKLVLEDARPGLRVCVLWPAHNPPAP